MRLMRLIPAALILSISGPCFAQDWAVYVDRAERFSDELLVQYSSSSSSLSTNLRFRWEYQPGSELFVVYTEGRSTLPLRGTDLESRGFVVKINRLFRF